MYYSSQSTFRPALNAQEYVSFGLKEIIPINHNTSTFRFSLPAGTNELGLPVASCLVTKFVKGTRADGMDDLVIRPYTPVVDESTPDVFDLVVKKYASNTIIYRKQTKRWSNVNPHPFTQSRRHA